MERREAIMFDDTLFYAIAKFAIASPGIEIIDVRHWIEQFLLPVLSV